METIKRNFYSLLKNRWDLGFFLCVGLDIDLNKIPACVWTVGCRQHSAVIKFAKGIIDNTASYVCAYKLNRAFYDAMPDDQGLIAMKKIIEYIHDDYPHIPVILDQKRDDIGNTNQQYVRQIMDQSGLPADAVTVHPTFGQEGLQPFLDCADKGIIILCKTSNSGSGEFQDLRVEVDLTELQNLSGLYIDRLLNKAMGWREVGHKTMLIPAYQWTALRVSQVWNTNNNCALVVGATFPKQLKVVRELTGDGFPLLIPGIGKQGGDLAATVAAAADSNGQGMIINASSSIIYASRDQYFDRAAYREAENLHTAIQYCVRETVMS